MILAERPSNIFESVTGPTVIVHGCNMQGMMGAGVAKTIKVKYPALYEDYHDTCCTEKKATLGGVHFYRVSKDLYIANAFTQVRLRDAQMDAIESCLKIISDAFPDHVELRSVRIGCGLGGLDWDDVRGLYEKDKGSWILHYINVPPQVVTL